jgi:hypothetical protein
MRRNKFIRKTRLLSTGVLAVGVIAPAYASPEISGDFTAYYIHQDNPYHLKNLKASFIEPSLRLAVTQTETRYSASGGGRCLWQLQGSHLRRA